uniref:Thiamine-triphosphatase n=1 Tax=Salvator merianae TaxID=96440 RepID=A0A8D0B944_SALMN
MAERSKAEASTEPTCPAGKDPRNLPSGSIEVEQKFIFGPGTVEKLVALGATPEGSVSFCDRYYDLPNMRLILADHWLRERTGAGWELKRPPQRLEGAAGSGSLTCAAVENQVPQRSPPEAPTSPPNSSRGSPQALKGGGQSHLAKQYEEVTHPRDIVDRVCGLLGVEVAAEWQADVAKMAEQLGLNEFARFVTLRRKFHLGDLNLDVDLDEADFGYAVGEIEAMVSEQLEIPSALQRIQKLGRQLDLDMTTPVPGKMSVYLHKFRPEHYEALVQARKLGKVGN